MSRLKKSRQQGWQKRKRFNKQRNNIARSLHFLLHYFFITARLGSERFLFKILLYNIEQHINQNVQNRTDMIFKRQKQEKNVKNGQHTRIWVQVFLWEIKVKTKLAWAVHVTKSLHLHFDKIQFKISLWWTLCGDRKRKKNSRLKISLKYRYGRRKPLRSPLCTLYPHTIVPLLGQNNNHTNNLYYLHPTK